MSEIPEHIDATSRKIVNSLAVLRAEMGCWSYDDMSKIVAEALLTAEKRGKEEAAKISDQMAERARLSMDEFRFNKFERRDFDSMSIAYVQAAAAIRGS